jgi:hypothetical protein
MLNFLFDTGDTMEKLTAEQHAKVKRMSSERLRIKLGKAGYDEEGIAGMDRNALLQTYAEHLLKAPAEQAGAAVKAAGAAEVELRKMELQLRQVGGAPGEA